MNLSQYIQLIKVLAVLIPAVVELVKSLEEIGETAGTGPEKLELVIDLLKTTFANLKTDVQWGTIEPIIRNVVEAILKIIRR